jgi:hypothetical protein
MLYLRLQLQRFRSRVSWWRDADRKRPSPISVGSSTEISATCTSNAPRLPAPWENHILPVADRNLSKQYGIK